MSARRVGSLLAPDHRRHDGGRVTTGDGDATCELSIADVCSALAEQDPDATASLPAVEGDALGELDDDERADVEAVLAVSGCTSPGARQWVERAIAEGIADPRPESMRLGRIARMTLADYGAFRSGHRRKGGR